MNVVASFLLATSFAYLGCALFSILKKPALVGVNRIVQTLFYLLAFIIFQCVSCCPSIVILNYLLGIAYAFASIGSFIGYPQKWKSYWKTAPDMGSDAGQIGMACWDLAISISLFILC